MEIIDIYYADCDQKEGPEPRWSTARSRDQLTDERSLRRLRDQLNTLRRKRTKLDFTFGDEVIQVSHPRNADVQSILQEILELPLTGSSLGELEELGDVLAQKYLETPYSRTRLFMVARVRVKEGLRLYTLVADLKSTFQGEFIDPESLNFASRAIPNWIGGLKKGAIYPAMKDDEPDEDALEIYDENQTRYYPESLECVPKQSEDKEAESLIHVMADVQTLTPDQVADVIHRLRSMDQDAFGSDELSEAMEGSGAEVDRQQVAEAWRRWFYASGYTISPDVLDRDSVTMTIKLDAFEIRCPLRAYPDRIGHRQEGGYHYIEVRGRHYSEVKAGRGRIRFGA